MNTSKILTITAFALVLSMSNFAMAKTNSKATSKTPVKTAAQAPIKTTANFRVALIDVQKVVDSSPTINALKVNRKNKLDDLVKFAENARTDVAKETDATKKKSLEDKYNKELNARKEAIDKEYVQKLSAVDKEITKIIESKTSNYDLILPKSNVLGGGVDITSEIIKKLK